jgi:hypothetical protein
MVRSLTSSPSASDSVRTSSKYHALTGKAILSSWVPGMPPTCADHQMGMRWPLFFRAGGAE